MMSEAKVLGWLCEIVAARKDQAQNEIEPIPNSLWSWLSVLKEI